ncbi:uncharacterized protein B0H64DRAFT_388093 [Chaetomium fimeti]|uniref:Ribosomal protein L34 n=1 Tax=Chaetomium fimeti TaxID=1854472 RepID=A0AAE0HMT4_9PEZI|nr:hypothetical protein B0H64DRAFT_388093 [Chaetomium fimeti]
MSRVSLQSPLLQAVLRRPTAQLIPRCALATTKPTAARSISHLPTLRPTLTTPSPIFRAANAQRFAPAATTTLMAGTETATGEVADVLGKAAVTAHPALAGCASQMRCGPRANMSGASRLIQKRRHGFLSRLRSKAGQKMITRRRTKGRKKLGH